MTAGAVTARAATARPVPGAADDSGVPGGRDLAVAVGAVVVDMFAMSDLVAPVATRSTQSWWVVVLAAAVGGVVLLGRRRWPVAVVGLLSVHACAVSVVLAYRPTVMVWVALATVASSRGARPAVAALALTMALDPAAWVVNEAHTRAVPLETTQSAALFAVNALTLAVAFGIGRWQRAGFLARRQLVRQRAEEARRAVADERRRLARELHDIVAHAVTVMVLQAAGARSVLTTDPGRATTALGAIEDMGVQATTELRRLLDVLRSADADLVPADADLDPARQPGLAQLDGLVASVRAAGLHVDVVEDGTRSPLDPSVDLTAYRIVQESLTNTLRHASTGWDAATVRLRWRDGGLEIEVADRGGLDARGAVRRSPDLSTGRGLAGVAERVAIVRGRLESGPSEGPGEGFRVRAVLPLPATGPRPDATGGDPPAGDVPVPVPRPGSGSGSEPAPGAVPAADPR